MLSSITPLGERGRNQRWGRTVGWYVSGSILGGAAIGLVAGGIGELLALAGHPPLPVTLGVLAVAAAAGAALDTVRWRHLLPTIHRQVNEDWLDLYRPWVYGGGFGFQLGLGVVTIVTTAAVYLLLVLVVLAGDWRVGLALGAVFGLSRAVPILRMRTVTSTDALASLFRRLAHAESTAERTLIVTQVVVSVTAVALCVSAVT